MARLDNTEDGGNRSQQRIVDVHGSNHYVLLQHSREVIAAMRAFLETQSFWPRP